MNKNYAFYSSGGSSRIIKFYDQNDLKDYPASFVYYDGDNTKSISLLKEIFANKLITKQSLSNDLSISISKILLHLLEKNKVDYLFCFGDKILQMPLIDIFKNRIINFHPSLLPAFPGLNSIDQALKSSVQLLGNTVHFIDAGIDTGPIIMQSVISRSAYNDYEDVLELQIYMLKTIWQLLEEDRIKVKNNIVTIDCPINKQPYFSL